MLELEGQIKMEEMCFLKMGNDSAAGIELGMQVIPPDGNS